MPENLREIPTYTLSEAAHYLRIPENSLRRWVLGYSYPTKAGKGYSKPLINIAGKDPNFLSFFNLVEAHVLCALRRKYGVRMLKIRRALDYLQKSSPSPHPFADNWLETDGIDIFIDKIDKLESISQQGQIAIRELLLQYLKRIERDEQKIAVRLYPYTTKPPTNETRLIVIDPTVSYGRPVIRGSGIPTSIIVERFEAGESFKELMDDYGRSAQEIEEALRFGRSAA